MRLKQIIGGALVCGTTATFAAHPEVSDVSISQARGVVEVAYTLSGASAVVTVDFQTNATENVWASIGEQNFTALDGDVNRLVDTGSRKIVWKKVKKSWPGHKIGEGGFRAVVKAWDRAQPPKWMTVDIASGAIRYYVSDKALPGGFSCDEYKLTKVLMRRIEAAGNTFQMGYGPSDNGSNVSTEDPHFVTFTNDYYMAVYETTQRQFENMYRLVDPDYVYNGAFAEAGGKRPASAGGKLTYAELRGPGSEVRWPQDGMHVGANSVFAKLRQKTVDGIFDLPTEAQWEFACRAGTQTDYNTGYNYSQGEAGVDAFSWNKNNANNVTHNVGELVPNAWDLYDMHGNVMEFCRDVYSDHLGSAHQIDPVGPVSEGSGEPVHIARGGSYLYNLVNLRSARRVGEYAYSNYGFRLWADGTAVYGSR
ncbi:MAG: SUMF1/EgtB/PvdO family nonheme iron enzyme [Kiritimatiellae bacterium]|nr:SUMF1/EgtB/PvdO family nonheme iron enzyme [Kiritimatiellia bacterium]MBQ6329799.1 SUMF1/EgtB/PvdO family nonheme iron enzyme [Kiritimatiellia bacterium]